MVTISYRIQRVNGKGAWQDYTTSLDCAYSEALDRFANARLALGPAAKLRLVKDKITTEVLAEQESN